MDELLLVKRYTRMLPWERFTRRQPLTHRRVRVYSFTAWACVYSFTKRRHEPTTDLSGCLLHQWPVFSTSDRGSGPLRHGLRRERAGVRAWGGRRACGRGDSFVHTCPESCAATWMARTWASATRPPTATRRRPRLRTTVVPAVEGMASSTPALRVVPRPRRLRPGLRRTARRPDLRRSGAGQGRRGLAAGASPLARWVRHLAFSKSAGAGVQLVESL
jgi:hypothetical protein